MAVGYNAHYTGEGGGGGSVAATLVSYFALCELWNSAVVARATWHAVCYTVQQYYCSTVAPVTRRLTHPISYIINFVFDPPPG